MGYEILLSCMCVNTTDMLKELLCVCLFINTDLRNLVDGGINKCVVSKSKFE